MMWLICDSFYTVLRPISDKCLKFQDSKCASFTSKIAKFLLILPINSENRFYKHKIANYKSKNWNWNVFEFSENQPQNVSQCFPELFIVVTQNTSPKNKMSTCHWLNKNWNTEKICSFLHENWLYFWRVCG